MNPRKRAHRISQFRYCSNKTQMTKALREKLARDIRVAVSVQGIRRRSFSTTSAWCFRPPLRRTGRETHKTTMRTSFMKIEGKSHGALWTQLLSCASTSIWRIRNAADRRIVQAHGTTNLRETIAVVQMCPSNGFIPPYSVGSKDEIGRQRAPAR